MTGIGFFLLGNMGGFCKMDNRIYSGCILRTVKFLKLNVVIAHPLLKRGVGVGDERLFLLFANVFNY